MDGKGQPQRLQFHYKAAVFGDALFDHYFAGNIKVFNLT